jgi:hypothetical protein
MLYYCDYLIFPDNIDKNYAYWRNRDVHEYLSSFRSRFLEELQKIPEQEELEKQISRREGDNEEEEEGEEEEIEIDDDDDDESVVGFAEPMTTPRPSPKGRARSKSPVARKKAEEARKKKEERKRKQLEKRKKLAEKRKKKADEKIQDKREKIDKKKKGIHHLVQPRSGYEAIQQPLPLFGTLSMEDSKDRVNRLLEEFIKRMKDIMRIPVFGELQETRAFYIDDQIPAGMENLTGRQLVEETRVDQMGWGGKLVSFLTGVFAAINLMEFIVMITVWWWDQTNTTKGWENFFKIEKIENIGPLVKAFDIGMRGVFLDMLLQDSLCMSYYWTNRIATYTRIWNYITGLVFAGMGAGIAKFSPISINLGWYLPDISFLQFMTSSMMGVFLCFCSNPAKAQLQRFETGSDSEINQVLRRGSACRTYFLSLRGVFIALTTGVMFGSSIFLSNYQKADLLIKTADILHHRVWEQDFAQRCEVELETYTKNKCSVFQGWGECSKKGWVCKDCSGVVITPSILFSEAEGICRGVVVAGVDPRKIKPEFRAYLANLVLARYYNKRNLAYTHQYAVLGGWGVDVSKVVYQGWFTTVLAAERARPQKKNLYITNLTEDYSGKIDNAREESAKNLIENKKTRERVNANMYKRLTGITVVIVGLTSGLLSLEQGLPIGSDSNTGVVDLKLEGNETLIDRLGKFNVLIEKTHSKAIEAHKGSTFSEKLSRNDVVKVAREHMDMFFDVRLTYLPLNVLAFPNFILSKFAKVKAIVDIEQELGTAFLSSVVAIAFGAATLKKIGDKINQIKTRRFPLTGKLSELADEYFAAHMWDFQMYYWEGREQDPLSRNQIRRGRLMMLEATMLLILTLITDFQEAGRCLRADNIQGKFWEYLTKYDKTGKFGNLAVDGGFELVKGLIMTDLVILAVESLSVIVYAAWERHTVKYLDELDKIVGGPPKKI